MKTVYLTETKRCDVCRTQDAKYDAPTTAGPWAYMCQGCFDRNSASRTMGTILAVGPEPQMTHKERRSAVRAAILDGDFDAAEDLIGDGDIAEYL